MLCLAGTQKEMGLVWPMATFTTCTLPCLGLHRSLPEQLFDPSFPSNKHSFKEGAELVLQGHGLVSVQAQSYLVTLKHSLLSHFSTCPGLCRVGMDLGLDPCVSQGTGCIQAVHLGFLTEKSRHVGTVLMCEVVFSVKSKYVLRDHLELEC